MDREDLDKQLKEHGEAMQQTEKGSHKGRMKIAALALAMLVIGGAGGCYFGEFQSPKKAGAASSYQMPGSTNSKAPSRINSVPSPESTANAGHNGSARA